MSAVAVIGLACRFPGASSPEELWRNLRRGEESITFFSEDELRRAGVDEALLRDPAYVAAKGVPEGADAFDAGFFGLSPREAALMDPQQRLFLECAWTALEDAGYESRSYEGTIGVFAGSILSVYLVQNLWPNRDLVRTAGTFQLAVGNDPTFLATSTAYHLDLEGPSVSVGTACSTSLVAVHLACQSLLAFESDMALAGGVSVHLPLRGGYRYEPGGILSPDGHCRPFDAAAQGTVSSDGAGVVVLKRLDDALADGDTVYAVIRGSAVNNDGSMKVGFTAPSAVGEAQVIAEAMALAEIEPETVSLIETHGAGTLLGDPIEFAGLLEAFGDCADRRGFCALGSVKANLGHLDAAAGIAGLIKTVLALRHREIPPMLHFENANPEIDLEGSPFYINRRLESFPNASPLRAGVSSFGIGGTNVHVVLEEASCGTRSQISGSDSRPYELLVLSAKTEAALEAASDRLADYLEHPEDFARGVSLPAGEKERADLADISFTLRCGRRAFERRRMLVAADREEAKEALRSRDPEHLLSAKIPAERPSVVFMFPGLGDHYEGMGWELYCIESEFRETVDHCAELLAEKLDGDIRDFLYPDRDWSNPVLESLAGGKEESRKEAGDLDLRSILLKAKSDQRGGAEEDRPAVVQPAIFVTEVALAQLLIHWGIEPETMIGYSIGEFAAAYLSGVLSLEDALELVAARARLIETRVEPGAMLAVPLAEEDILPLLSEGLSLGAVNGARLTVVSGETGPARELEKRLRARGVSSQQLKSTHAYHSTMMEPIVEPLKSLLRRLELHPPEIPYISCMTGTLITAEEATDPEYWAKHLCRTVRFQKGISVLLDNPRNGLVEVGPGQTLAAHAIRERARLPDCENRVIPTMRRAYAQEAEAAVLMRGVGELWLIGAPLDMTLFSNREKARRLPLPTYPFERKRHFIDPPTAAQAAAQVIGTSVGKNPDVKEWFYLPTFKPSVRPQTRPITMDDGGWVIFVDGGCVGLELAERLRLRGAKVVTVEAGERFFRRDDEAFLIDPFCDEDYSALVRDLRKSGRLPTDIVHMWSLTPGDREPPTRGRFETLQEIGYRSVLRLLRAFVGEGQESSLRLQIVANHLFEVEGGDELIPEKATLRGPAMVAPQEYPGLLCRCLDTDLPPEDPERRDALVAELLREITGDTTDPAVAYRRGRRFVLGYEKVHLEATDEERSALRPRGVYLLTGGLGGVGLVLARHLARTVKARLVLVGRSAFPRRADWDDWLEKRGEDATSRKIRQLRELEDFGAEVLVLSADVADARAMRRALAAVDERFGELHGVLHGAGAVGVETFAEIRRAETSEPEAQFVAKVHGLMVLERALAGRSLDFCLLMSSLSAVLGGLGFAAYSAANLFMDAFARFKNRSAETVWTSVNWDSWRLVDVRPVIEGLGATVTDFVMEPEEGADACERALAEGGLGQIVVSSGDLEARLRLWVGRDAEAFPDAGQAPLHERPNLSASFKAPQGELERELAEIWQELFGIDGIGVNDNFFELGGHSLMATQLNARLFSKLSVEMSLAELLQAPTIAALARAVTERQRARDLPEQGAIAAQDGEGPAALSFAQERAFFLDRLSPGDPAHNIAGALRLDGELEPTALGATLTEIVRRHAPLRARFSASTDETVQEIRPARSFPLKIVDLCALPEALREDEKARLYLREVRSGFDLTGELLLRATLLRLAPEEHLLLLSTHRIAADGWSIGVVMKEIFALYPAFFHGRAPDLPELSIQYADFAAWQRGRMAEGLLDRGLAYWQRQLTAPPPVLELPGDLVVAPAAPVQGRDLEGATLLRVVEGELREKLEELCRREDTTLFVMLLSAFMVLLMRLTGREDILIGCPVSGRKRVETEALVGLFVNTIALRTPFERELSFRDALARVKRTVLEGLAHDEVPFERVIQELDLDRGASHHPLFETVFNFTPSPPRDLDLPGLSARLQEPPTMGAKFSMELFATDWEDALELKVLYPAELYSEARMSLFLDQLHFLFEQIADDPGRTLGALDLVSPLQKALLPDPSARLEEPEQVPVARSIADVSRRVPEEPAICQGKLTVSYAELGERMKTVAETLRGQGLEPAQVVAVLGPRSPGVIIAMAGVLHSGGVLLTLSPDLPQERHRIMLEVAGASYLLHIGRWREEDEWIRELSELHILEVDREGRVSEPFRPPRQERVSYRDPAYIFFTSGSTGRPKAIQGTHHGLAHFLDWQRRTFDVGPWDRCGQLTGLSFDVVLRDVFLPLISGAALVLPSEDHLASAEETLRWLEDEEISLLHTVPTLAETWLRAHPVEVKLASLKRIFFAGEPLTASLVERWRRAFPRAGEIVNLYGPTETTLAKCYYRVPQETRAGIQSLGRPLPQTDVLVLTPERRLCGIAEAGEIAIRTPFRSLGYLNAPEENEKRFIENPFAEGGADRLYLTGDRGAYDAMGLVEFLGRLDHQVKIRGVRVEPTEIAVTLESSPDVAACAVVTRDDGPEGAYLAAYVVWAEGVEEDTSRLRDFLRRRLPAPMIPSAFVFLDRLPLTSNQKLDRGRLPAPGGFRPKLESRYVAPRDAAELRLTKIWEELLRVRPVGVRDNFFDLGGHSLMALQLLVEVERELGGQVSLPALFENPTIEHLAAVARQQEEAWPRVVRLWSAEHHLKLFLVHPGGGILWNYVHLVRHLAPQIPVYGLQARGLDGRSDPHRDLEEMASDYLEEILRLQSEGPYLLAGHSMGGLIAFEMARQLGEAGREVALLAMLDSTPSRSMVGNGAGGPDSGDEDPAESARSKDAKSLAEMTAAIERFVGKETGVSYEKLCELPGESQIEYVVEALERSEALPYGGGADLTRRLLSVSKAHIEASRAYRARSSQVPITLIRAREGNGDTPSASADHESLGWNALSAKPVQVFWSPGDHVTMMSEPHVRSLAKTLESCLERVLSPRADG